MVQREKEALLLADELRDPNPIDVGIKKNRGGMASATTAAAHLPSTATTATTKTRKEIQLAEELRDPVTIRPTYSMRSVKTSEGTEVNHGDYLSHFQREILGDAATGGGRGKIETNRSQLQPFDETVEAGALSNGDGANTTIGGSSSPSKPTQSCLKPSSFSGEPHSTVAATAAITTTTKLVNPTTIQRNRSNRSGGSSSNSKNLSSKFRRMGNMNESSSSATALHSQNTIGKQTRNNSSGGGTTTKDSIACFSAPVASVSFADDLEQNNHRPADETNPANYNNKINKSITDKESSRQFSPIAVDQFFAPEILLDEDENGTSGGVGSGGGASNSNITNRLARNRQALKSIALAKGSAKHVRKKEQQAATLAAALARGKTTETAMEKNDKMESRDEGATSPQTTDGLNKGVENDVNHATKGSDTAASPPLSPMEQEGSTPAIIQSVSDLDIPQFSPSLEANHAAKQQRVDSPVDEGQEVDELTILNTSDTSMNSKKKRFLLPRLLGGRNKGKDDGSGTTKSPKRSKGKENGGIGKSTPKRSMRSKFFGNSKKKDQVKKEKVDTSTAAESEGGTESKVQAVSNNDGETKALSPAELEAIKEVEKYTAWLAPSSTPSEIKEVEKYTAWLTAPPAASPSKTVQEEPPQSLTVSTPESATKQDMSTPSTGSIPLQERAPSMSAAVAAAAMQNLDDLSTIVGIETSKADASTVVEKDVVIRTMGDDDENPVVSKSKPISFFGARARSTSTKASTNSKASKASTVSKASSSRSLLSRSPSRASLVEPSAMEIPLQVTSKEAETLLDSSILVESPGGETQASNANAGFASTNNIECSPDNSREGKKSIIGASTANALKQMLPDFGFVGADVSGEVEAGIEVEWGVSVMEKNEFGDKGIALDMTAVNAELEKNLSEPKWDNHSKATDDFSWASIAAPRQSTVERKPSIGSKSMDVLSEAGASSTTDNRCISNEEGSTVSGATKPSLLHPIKLIKRRSRSRDSRKPLKLDDSNEETVFGKDEETVFSKDEGTIFSKDDVDSRKRHSSHPVQKRRYLGYRSRKSKDDSRSIDDDSEYSSSDYSSDDEDGEREDVVGTIATSLHKGLADIVDMMENAFAFNKDEETIVSASESSEGSEEGTLDDDESYIQRKIAQRRNKQRRLLQESRRSKNHRLHYQRKKMCQSNSRDDDESLLSEEVHRREKKHKSSRKLNSSGRARNRQR